MSVDGCRNLVTFGTHVTVWKKAERKVKESLRLKCGEEKQDSKKRKALLKESGGGTNSREERWRGR